MTWFFLEQLGLSPDDPLVLTFIVILLSILAIAGFQVFVTWLLDRGEK